MTAMALNETRRQSRSTTDPASEALVNSVRQYLTIQSAYEQCDDDMKRAIDSMARVFSDPAADEDEKEMALNTIAEALFPGIAVDVMNFCERLHRDDPDGRNAEMIKEESTFAENVQRVMSQKGWTQERLATAIGVSQPAIANMLARQCRPQQKTVVRIADALGVQPNTLWPATPSKE